MSQHSYQPEGGPSVVSIVMGVALVVASSTGAAFIISAPDLDARHIVGTIMASGLTVLLGVQTVQRGMERAVAAERERAARRAQRERAVAAERERAARRERADRERAARRERADRERADRELFQQWQNATYGPDPVVTQPEAPYWDSSGEVPQGYEEAPQGYEEAPAEPEAHRDTPEPGAASTDRSRVEMGLAPQEPEEPGRFPFHPRPTERSAYYDRHTSEWPTESIARQG